MATGKNSFILYSDYIHTAQNLPDEVAGKLFKTILEFVNDKNPEPDDLIVKVAFEPIKQQLKRDLKEWEKAIEGKSNSGRIGNLKRWNIDLYNKLINKQITLEEAEVIAECRKSSHSDKNETCAINNIAKIAVTVNDTVTVNDNDNIKDNKNIDSRMKEFYSSLAVYVEEFSKETVRAFYEYWTEHSPKGKKMRFEKETVFDIKKRLNTWRSNERRKFEEKVKTGKKQQIINQVAPAYQNLMEKFENEGN